MVSATSLPTNVNTGGAGHVIHTNAVHTAINEVTALLNGLTNFTNAVKAVINTGNQSADTIVDGTTNKAFTAVDDTKLGTVGSYANQVVVRYNSSTGVWEVRPSGAAFGVVFLSTNSAAAPEPPTLNRQVGDIWRRHPDATPLA